MWNKAGNFLVGHWKFIHLLAAELLGAALLCIEVVKSRGTSQDLTCFGKFESFCE